jgi:hypothetical protein
VRLVTYPDDELMAHIAHRASIEGRSLSDTAVQIMLDGVAAGKRKVQGRRVEVQVVPESQPGPSFQARPAGHRRGGQRCVRCDQPLRMHLYNKCPDS